MKFLLVAKQKKNVDSFRSTILRLLKSGHEVTLAIEERDPERDRKLLEEFASPAFGLQTPPSTRSDAWRMTAPLARRVRDWIQYLGPEYAGAHKLRQRTMDKLRIALGAHAASMGNGLIPGFGPEQVFRVKSLLARIEESIPSDPLYEEFVSRPRPDAVLVTPGIHFGSAQADFIKSARSAGIPVWMLLFSWDNLSTKGALHVAPDRMFVWNERQRVEAEALHGFPSDRVTVVGAPRFDEFFDLRPALTRPGFFAPLGLDPDRPTLLYVCSSRFVVSRELSFVRRWLAALRSAPDAALRGSNVVVRPHPDIALLEDDDPEFVRWPQVPLATGYVSRPFDDDRAIVLRTSNATQQTFYECLYHSAAVVGLNTSAELEAAVVGRPVFTVIADDEEVEGQASTLHFHYLLKESGGFVVSAPDLQTHLAQLSQALVAPPDGEAIRRFANESLRPRGDRPVAAILVRALVKAVNRGALGETVGAVMPSSGADVAPAADPAADPKGEDRDMKVVRIQYPGSNLQMWASSETRKFRRRGAAVPDEATIRWLDEHVAPGDVVYDIGAGAGMYSLIAATHRGALTVAIEPGFASYKRLCDNILLNDCRRSVIPLPATLGDQTGLRELEYPPNAPGGTLYNVNARLWRSRTESAERHYVQPVCVERLDDLVRRHGLPPPQHLRLASPGSADRILAGATNVLRRDAKSILLVAGSDDVAAHLRMLLASHGLAAAAQHEISKGAQVLVFVRARSNWARYWPWSDAWKGRARVPRTDAV